jgi:hypothetical protein
MFIDFPDMRLLPTVLVSVIAERYHLVIDVVKFSIEKVVPWDGVVRINDLNPTAMFLNDIRNVIE